MVCVTWNQWIFTSSEHTYKIFMECSGAMNLLSSQNLVYYVRCLFYILMGQILVLVFAGKITGYQGLFVISGGLFHMALLCYFMTHVGLSSG